MHSVVSRPPETLPRISAGRVSGALCNTSAPCLHQRRLDGKFGTRQSSGKMSTGLIRKHALGLKQLQDLFKSLGTNVATFSTGKGPAQAPPSASKTSSTPKKKTTKRAPTAYNLFQRDPVLKHQLEGLPIGERARKAAAMWKEMHPDEKAKFEADAELGRPLKKEKKTSNKPKSAYTKYVTESFKDARKDGMTAADTFKLLGSQWKEMSPTQKAKYG